jgi:O-antigen/teichoic acid export membrane protein
MNFSIMGLGIILRASTQLIILVISSRLFTPADIGAAAIIFAIYHLVWPWFEVAIVQSYYQIDQKDNERFESLGLLIMLSGICAILIALGLTFVFEKITPTHGLWVALMMGGAITARSFSALSSADLLKTLQVKQHTIIEQGSYIIGYAVALGLCVKLDLGALYLVIGILLHSLISCVLFQIYKAVSIQVNYHGKKSLEMAVHSGGYFIASGLSTFVREANILLIGVLISTSTAAFYSRALQVYMLGAFTIGQVFDKLLTPMFRKNIAQGVKNGQLFDLSTLILISVLLPSSAFLYLNAETVITLLFGSSWATSAPILRVLTLALTFRTCSKINEATLRAYGLAWQRVFFYVLWAGILLICAYPATRIGVIGFAWTECAGVILFWTISSRSASKLVDRNWHTQSISIASSIPVVLVYVTCHFAMNYSLHIYYIFQLGLELFIVITLAGTQIALVTKLRYRNIGALRQFI